MQPEIASAGNGEENLNISQTVKLLHTRKEAAAMLSLSVRTLDYAIEHGDIVVRRVGRKVLITHQALQQFARRDHGNRRFRSPNRSDQ